MGTLEQQINAIESANINRETLAAMEKAGEAMRQIHGKLTPQKVDETMCVLFQCPLKCHWLEQPSHRSLTLLLFVNFCLLTITAVE